MSPEVHRAALRAAAKLALSAAFIGCGAAETGELAEAQAGPDDSASSDETASDELRAKKKKAKKSACVQTYCRAEHPTRSEEQCCKAEVAAASFPTTPASTPGPDTRVDALTRGCCAVLAQAADKAGTWDWPERGECCAALGWQGSATCTPWGPPVPPAMRGVA
jgi:hypothetical protein